MRGEIKSKQDRREVRNFQRFLRLLPRYELRMLQRPRWQKYLGLTSQEAWLCAKGKRKFSNGENGQ